MGRRSQEGEPTGYESLNRGAKSWKAPSERRRRVSFEGVPDEDDDTDHEVENEASKPLLSQQHATRFLPEAPMAETQNKPEVAAAKHVPRRARSRTNGMRRLVADLRELHFNEIYPLVRSAIAGLAAVLGVMLLWLAQHEGHITEFVWICSSVFLWLGMFCFLAPQTPTQKRR